LKFRTGEKGGVQVKGKLNALKGQRSWPSQILSA
jgi:hypothetical protein